MLSRPIIFGINGTSLSLAATVFLLTGTLVTAQRTVRATDAVVMAPATATGDAQALVTIENGTMYDVYLVGASSDAAATVELRDASSGKAVLAREVPVPAFGALEMSPKTVHIVLSGLKQPLASGARVPLTLSIDGQEPLTVDAVVK